MKHGPNSFHLSWFGYLPSLRIYLFLLGGTRDDVLNLSFLIVNFSDRVLERNKDGQSIV
jgi:hypothetical protein